MTVGIRNLYFLAIVACVCFACTQNKPANKIVSSLPKKDTRIILVPDTTTFEICKISEPKKLLSVVEFKILVQNKYEDKLYFFDPSQLKLKVVENPMNGFVYAIHTAFSEHRPLTLKPDDIWLCIVQGLSIHINHNYEKYGSKIVNFKGKKQLVMRNDELGETAEAWGSLIDSFSAKASGFLKNDFATKVIPQFTTTSRSSNIAYKVTLLETVHKSFEYIGMTGCGIPRITLHGRKEDWQNIKNRLQILDAFDMQYWHKELDSVVNQFIAVYDKKQNNEFWKNIYKLTGEEYEPSFVSGWVVKLFPYLKTVGENLGMDSTQSLTKYESTYIKNKFLSNSMHSNIQTSDFPSGISKIDVKWEIFWGKNKKMLNTPVEKNMQIHAGFFGLLQDSKTHSLSPNISWVVCTE